jgi:2-polyprenyl-3-methyl-5-hydroxy-6-metoxy-1,4-benzoquinol methylase
MTESKATKFADTQEYAAWISSQSWYQSINLPSGNATRGKFDTHRRIQMLEDLPMEGKRVIDIGCNSGQYALYAKARGAREVVGIDLDEQRINQARTLAVNEDLDVTFEIMGLQDAAKLGRFDTVMCFAVLTEIEDFFGSVRILKSMIGERAVTEIGLVNHGWVSLNPRTWVRASRLGVRPWEAVADVRKTTNGLWVVQPSFAVLKLAFGDEFNVIRRGAGLRYDLIDVIRR